jgi:transcription initiation factor TFIIIB Brf1 subunit/transcription initiation factor TFIIB
MQPMKMSYRCEQCGIDKRIYEQKGEYSSSITNNYNTLEDCPISIKIVGKDSYRYQKALFKYSSDYGKTQSNTTNKQLDKCNAQSKMKLKKIILREAAGLYREIQKLKIVCRGKGRLGVLCSCTGYVCKRHDITKKPKELAMFFGIEESYLSDGDRLLRRLHADKKIDIPVHHNPKNAYLRQYFESLEINLKYKQFVSELIDKSTGMDMMGDNNSRISTKCAGAIYALIVQENLKISKKQIVEDCKISKSTFLRYYEYLVINRKALKPIFLKHKVAHIRKRKKKKRPSRTMVNMQNSDLNKKLSE